ncbi:stage II sporulation protein E [Streptomyces sp. Amel2xB2]|uniref:PP2C family protein-serine/threonine phosphatase n=1 Tax=Streptomyces sp. Amel2xB2 TaxID=1305829 RepID=UPI000DB98062|nr:PP2C family protein-serine/threonine phosphatase [Streptomyces sp. Amel2xB2]RAJ66792.1 stage II sporulation protein E [Streptomyces sp. Amel2xB2]
MNTGGSGSGRVPEDGRQRAGRRDGKRRSGGRGALGATGGMGVLGGAGDLRGLGSRLGRTVRGGLYGTVPGAMRAPEGRGPDVLSAGMYRRRRTRWLPLWVRGLPPALVVLALVLELVTPTRYSFASFLTAAVVLAALLTRPLVTVVTGLLSVVLLTAMHLGLEDVYPDNITGPVITLVLVTGFSTLLAIILERTTLQLVQVQAVAEATQRALLRPLPDRVGPLRLAGVYRAADEAALIGGDLYSVRPTPFGVRVVIGDVRGKGIGATEGVATITSAFREAAMVCGTLSEVAARIEAAMALDREDMETGGSQATPAMVLPKGWSQELFATAVLLEFPLEGGLVRVLNRGHPPLFRIGGPDGVSPLRPEPALPLGFGDLAQGQPTEQRYELARGETLIAYSDGVTEARGRDGTFYPLGQRLAERYGDPRDGGTSGSGAVDAARGDAGAKGAGATDAARADIEPAEVVAFISDDVTRWAPTINDDLVIVVLQHEGAAPEHAASAASPSR